MLTQARILNWLRATEPARLEVLWRLADAVRRAHVGDAVHLRGLIEISNVCVRLCGYCGLRAPNRAVERYRMSSDEILACARQARDFGYGTVVLQAGEDPALTCEFVAEVVRRIKRETGLAVTLSLGERPREELAAWREAGADRYLLRFETSNGPLFDAIHPPRGAREGEPRDASRNGAGLATRLDQLRALRELGYEVGSGVMIGIPGQTYADLARDIALFRELDLDMIGCGPFLPHPATPLGREALADEHASEPSKGRPAPDDQVPGSELMAYKVIALARLVCPRANIPSTTALATINPTRGRELGLSRGANIVMPNLTPTRYRTKYEIYPGKACITEDAAACNHCLSRRIESIDRVVGQGPGGSPNWRARMGGES